tara:strand:- start:296 stop:538 length:243 start_codon:yes stop_codon:yes gene_type:complete
MENLWKQLKPAVRKQILVDKDIYPMMINSCKEELEAKMWWTDLSVQTVRHVATFTHNTLISVSVNDLLWGEKFLKKTKNV